MQDKHESEPAGLRPAEPKSLSRREFLKYAGFAGAVIAAGTGLGGLLAACGESTATTTTNASAATTAATGAVTTSVSATNMETIKIGVAAPLSGGVAFLGKPMVAAGKLWEKQTNDSGGLLGQQVELMIEDEASDPKTTAEKAKALVGKGAKVLTGPLLGTEFGALMPVAREANLIMLYNVYAWGGKEFTDPLMFTTGTIPSQTVTPFVPWLAEQFGKKFYVIGSDYQYGHINADFVKKAVGDLGGEMVGEEYTAFGTTDFSSSLTRIAKANPDVLFGLVVGDDAVGFTKQLYDSGLKAKLPHYTSNVDAVSVSASTPEQLEGVSSCMAYFDAIDTPTNKTFVDAYKEYWPDVPPTDITASFWLSLFMWGKAVEMAGTTETAAVKAKLEGLTVDDTPMGSVTLRATDHYPIRNTYIAQVKSGKLVVVKDLGVIDPGEDQRTVVYS